MADIATAPIDPIFYLHHCNIDRLWNAWSLRSTSRVPSATSSYWNGSFTYARGLTISKSKTRTTTGLSYDYANDTMPAVLPPQAQQGRIIRVQAQIGAIQARPKTGPFTASPGRTVSSTRRSLGGVKGVVLDEFSISASIPLQAANATALKDVLATSPAVGLSQSSDASQATPQASSGFQYVKVVLDGVKMPAAARKGGFFYNVYLNLPASGDVDAVKSQHFIGTLGAFQVATAAHHGMSEIDYDVTDVLARLGISNVSDVVLSFVRVSGANAPKGMAVSINEARIELGTDGP
jgi:tyrosinase